MPRRLRPLWEASWRYARYSALKYPRAASLAINQERLVESVADHAKIRKQALSLQNKLKFRMRDDAGHAMGFYRLRWRLDS